MTEWNPERRPLPALDQVVARYRALGPDGSRPRIVNEYAWLWLQRDGEPTTLTRAGYEACLPGATADQRRDFYARRLAAMTEALRASRRVAGVLHFCGLGHSFPGCATSDHFLDLDSLEFEPHFLEFVPHAFAPVGLLLQVPDTAVAGAPLDLVVTVFNDLDGPWRGPVTLVAPPDVDAMPMTRKAEVQACGAVDLTFPVRLPERAGAIEWEATLTGSDGQLVRSRRLMQIESP